MRDFSKMLIEMVENLNGEAVVLEAAKPKVSLMDTIKTLKQLAKTVDAQVKIMDEELEQLLGTVREKLKGVKKQFGGLRHLSSEQKAHIEEVTNEANDRLKKLKQELAPLKKLAASGKGGGSVQGLIDRVTDLEGQLAAKQSEMESQKMDYEDLLDYYEDIMIQMKHSEMEAKRALRDAEAEMAGAFDHTELFGDTLTEAVKPKPKKVEKKKPVDPNLQHYGTFDLTEHLKQARESLPKERHDW